MCISLDNRASSGLTFIVDNKGHSVYFFIGGKQDVHTSLILKGSGHYNIRNHSGLGWDVTREIPMRDNFCYTGSVSKYAAESAG